MRMIEKIKAKARADVKRIVLPEGDEPRTIAAAETIRREGMAQGIVQTLASLVRDGVLSIKEAAARGAMTETEFRTQMHTLSLSV